MKRNNHSLALLICLILSLSACGLNKRLNKVSEYESDGLTSIMVRDDYAYLTSSRRGNGFLILDISNPSSPEPIGKYPVYGATQDISSSGNYAYIVSRLQEGLQVLDISDPTHPNLIGTYDKPGDMISIQDDYAYYITSLTPHGPRVMEILDISNPAMIVPVGIYDVNKLEDDSAVTFVATENNFAYANVSQSGVEELRILDISKPMEPIEIGSLSIITPFYDSVIEDDYLYLAHGDGLTIVDVTDRTSPQIISAIEDSFVLAVDIEIEGNYAYIADKWNVRVVDITNPTEPFEITSYKLEQVNNVAIAKEYLYALESLSWEGIIIFDKPR